ncbi:MAG: hypothetical protein K2M43_00405 [Mycoplasmoidaceae bacterium]|nr:hypothetical protein [Mycoplasmoidaceae bacterium]
MPKNKQLKKTSGPKARGNVGRKTIVSLIMLIPMAIAIAIPLLINFIVVKNDITFDLDLAGQGQFTVHLKDFFALKNSEVIIPGLLPVEVDGITVHATVSIVFDLIQGPISLYGIILIVIESLFGLIPLIVVICI